MFDTSAHFFWFPYFVHHATSSILFGRRIIDSAKSRRIQQFDAIDHALLAPSSRQSSML